MHRDGRVPLRVTPPRADARRKLADGGWAVAGPLGRLPDVLWDGYVDPALGGPGDVLCVQNGEARVLNVDSPNDNKSPRIADDGVHDCAFEKLPAVELTGPLAGL